MKSKMYPVAATIQQVSISQFRQFKETHTFEFATPEEGSGLTSITGMNGAGKTTIFDALRLCLYGKLETDYPRPYVTHELIDSLEVGEVEYAKLSIVLRGANRKQYRVNRVVQTVMTPRGAENDIEEAKVEILEGGDWTQDSGLSIDDVLSFTLPKVIEPIVFHNGETSLGISEEWVENIGITELAEIVLEASQNFPEPSKSQAENHLSSREDTVDALLKAANDYFSEMTFRDEIQLALDSESKQPEAKIMQEHRAEYVPSAGEQMITSVSFLLAFIEVLPANPPLVFDTVLGRADYEIREEMLNQFIAAAEKGQVILMSTPHSVEDTPGFDIIEGSRIEL